MHMIHIAMISTHTLQYWVNHVVLNLQMQGGDTSIHPVHRSLSSVKIPSQGQLSLDNWLKPLLCVYYTWFAFTVQSPFL